MNPRAGRARPAPFVLFLFVAVAWGVVVVPPHCVPVVRKLFTKQRSFHVPINGSKKVHSTSMVATACAADAARCAVAVDLISSKFVVPNAASGFSAGDSLLEILPSPEQIPGRPRLIDIGCGLAVYHRNLSAFYGHRSEHVLVDRTLDEVHTGKSTRRWNSYSTTEPLGFYNSLECARDILQESGVPAEHIKLVNASAKDIAKAVEPSSVDVAISIMSLGYHYPADTYASVLALLLKPVIGRLFVTVAPWAASKHQATALEAVGFTCASTGTGFMRCCMGCRKDSLSGTRRNAKSTIDAFSATSIGLASAA